MKKITTLLLVIFCNITSYDQWVPTGISTNSIEGINAVASHNGTLFASASTEGLIKSTNNGTSWEQVGQTGFATDPTSRRVSHIRSAGDALYAVTFYANTASSMIYKSTDNGQSFVPDVDGMPVYAGEIVDVDYFYSHNDQLVAVVNSGNYIKSVSASTWQRNNDLFTEFSEHFAFYGSKFYAWGSYYLRISEDNGQTWSQAADANLPQFFLANNLTINPDSGRLYVSGRSLFNFIHKLYYSDDEGATWIDMNIGAHLGTNWIGVGQTIQEIFAQGNHVQLSLDNDANNSIPDVLVSTDGGLTFATDTAGLPSNGGTTHAFAFVAHNDYLFMALNFIDIYRKDFSTLGVSNANTNTGLNVYPNPSNREFFIQSSTKVNEIQVYGTNGQLLQTFENGAGVEKINLEHKGLFLIKLIDDDENITIKKIIKN